MTGDQVQQVGQRVLEMQKAIDLIDATPQEQYTLELDNTKIALEAGIAQLARYTRGIDQVQGILGSTQEQAVDFSAALADLQSALTIDEQIAALANVRALFIQIKGGAENLTDEQRALLTQIVQTSLATYDLADGTATVSSNLDAAASGASRMADELSRAVGNAASLASQSIAARTQAEIKLKYKDDPIGAAQALAESRFSSTVAPVMQGAPPEVERFVQGLRRTYVENEVAAAEAAKCADAIEQHIATARKLQGEKDKARAEVEKLKADATAQIEAHKAELSKIQSEHAAMLADMKEKLATAQTKCERLVSGGMTFSPDSADKGMKTAGDVDPRNRLHPALR
jgi:hypothetical protein